MPQQLSWRLGWQSQNLARFILYKFSFLTEPVYTVDDIGGDFFCTLFEPQSTQTNVDLLPRNSFWIQVKSEDESQRIDLTKNVPMLLNLEMPFFIGTVDRSNLKLTIFSGHYLTPFFSYKDPKAIKQLQAQLCDKSAITGLNDDYFAETSGNFVLYFPKVTEITAQTSDADLKEAVTEIRNNCSLMLQNIAARISNEYTLETHDGKSLLFYSGPASLPRFQVNFLLRLGEAFFNVNNAYNYPEHKSHARKLFDLYQKIYHDVASFYNEEELPPELKALYQAAKGHIQGK